MQNLHIKKERLFRQKEGESWNPKLIQLIWTKGDEADSKPCGTAASQSQFRQAAAGKPRITGDYLLREVKGGERDEQIP